MQVQDFTNVDLEVANGRNFTPFLVEVYDSPAHMDSSKHCLGQLVLEEGMLLCTTLRAITWSLIAPGIFPTAEYNKAGVKVSTKLKARADIPNNNKMSRHVFEFNASGPARLSIDGNIIVATPDIYSKPGVLGWRNFGNGLQRYYGINRP